MKTFLGGLSAYRCSWDRTRRSDNHRDLKTAMVSVHRNCPVTGQCVQWSLVTGHTHHKPFCLVLHTSCSCYLHSHVYLTIVSDYFRLSILVCESHWVQRSARYLADKKIAKKCDCRAFACQAKWSQPLLILLDFLIAFTGWLRPQLSWVNWVDSTPNEHEFKMNAIWTVKQSPMINCFFIATIVSWTRFTTCIYGRYTWPCLFTFRL